MKKFTKQLVHVHQRNIFNKFFRAGQAETPK